MEQNETRLVLDDCAFEDTWTCEKCGAKWVYSHGHGDTSSWEYCPACWREIDYPAKKEQT